MYMSVSMLINSSFHVATPCLAIIFLTMHMRDEKGRGTLLKLSARRKHVRTANCGQSRDVCNQLSGYSGYSDIRKNLSVRIVI